MGMFSADVNDLRDLYIESLRKALSSERQIVETGLPGMIKAATNPELAEAFRTHLEESRGHAANVASILQKYQDDDSTSKCKATATLISEGESAAGDAANTSIRDVILIAGGNKVEHHEIAVYGTLRTWATLLGETDDALMLENILTEEKNADQLLDRIAQRVNVQTAVTA
jgi:ferritin-like metal-binding protein YciE